VKYMPDQNKVLLSNGREYTYKALVLAPGLDHQESGIEGLADMYHNSHESENVFVHMLDNKERMSKNFWHGWNHTKGDMICYAPKDPHKGEGTDFWALYYESFLRQNHQIGRSAADTRIQFWSPNEYIYKFPYANEIALDECHKRGIDVNLGWEMTKVHYNEIGEKIATFKHVSTGETKEHPFMHANINPPSSPFQEIVDAGLGDHQGMIDVNPYTLQHNKYENIFAFGDAVAGETTRTQHSAVAQVPVVKHNLLNFMAGAELNGIYDGYTYMPFYLGHSNANCFQHLYDYEPAPMNHWVPNYGLFSEMYFKK
jgi:sulfide:quinone oxidoreductase